MNARKDFCQQQVISAFDAIKDVPEVQTALEVLQSMTELDHLTFHMTSTIDGKVDAPYVKSTYPSEWIKRYVLMGYVRVDPVVINGFSRQLPFFWSDLEATGKSLKLMQDALAHGIGPSGYSIPVVDYQGRRSLFSVSSGKSAEEWADYISSIQEDLATIANSIHRKAVAELYGHDQVHFPHLSQRELECLSWSAKGKDSGAISIILAISEHTVRAYLKSARHKLDCSTVSQAVAKAIQLRMIVP